jgi:hypothetical protein
LPSLGAVECPRRFDTARWTATAPGDARQTLARQVVKCGFVRTGDAKRRVETVLGRARRDELQSRDEYRREWPYLIGDTNGALGPADAQDLYVEFSRDGRVTDLDIEPP